jgi:CheY-like chemotaxis protein
MTRILLVEDDDNQRLFYREDFQDHGYEVVEARNGVEALHAIERHAPDAVVLDINMAGLDGLSTLTRIHDRHRRLPVVLNSAYAAYRDQFVSWIADAYVTKSSNPAQLRHTVQSVIASAGKAA